MDPILAEIYSTVMSAAPYVIAAYALIWLILLVFVLIVFSGQHRTERQLAALTAALAASSKPQDQAKRWPNSRRPS
ncbi:MAG: hypothetical protein FWC59_03785 [Actinomycetia bacterium]|nr:hypothetical protein [Actinomycetes bacterium]